MEQENKTKLNLDKNRKTSDIEEVDLSLPKFKPGQEVFLERIQHLFRAQSSAPTHTPKNFSEQIVFYKSGSTYRIYFWVEDAWKYVALT